MSTASPAAPAAHPLRLAVLGPPTAAMVADHAGKTVRVRRNDGIQMLVYLAVSPKGATSDEIMAALWPEIRPRYSRSRFHTTMSELRKLLANAAGAEAIPRVVRYRLNPDLINVDLWQLNSAVENAAAALDPKVHDTALHKIINLYPGDIADGQSWLWLIPYRERARRHVLDAHIALAETATDPQAALRHVQDAIRLDPLNEDNYRRAMHLHARLENLDGIRRTMRALSQRLAEIDTQISPQTQQLARELAARLRKKLVTDGH